MDAAVLSSEDKIDLAVQLASVISTWRQAIPKSLTCGNIHFQACTPETADLSLYQTQLVTSLDSHIYGLLGSGNDFCPPSRSLLEYWQMEIKQQISKLSTDGAYISNREALLSLLYNFLEVTLPNLPIFQHIGKDNFTFTHTDFFPRNVLVQGSPPKVTGIVDWEFSGFFPPMEEFVREWIPDCDESDWPSDMYEMMLEELERLGEGTPRSLSDGERAQLKNLNALRKWIAPWWMAQGGGEGDEVAIEEELRLARYEVKTAVEGLVRLVSI